MHKHEMETRLPYSTYDWLREIIGTGGRPIRSLRINPLLDMRALKEVWADREESRSAPLYQNSIRALKAITRAGSVLLKTPAVRLVWFPLASHVRPVPTPLYSVWLKTL